jgi:hypothetical protein
MYWSSHMVGTAIASNIVYTKGIKVETRVKIRDGHLSWVLPHSKFRYREAIRKPHDTINIKGDSGRAFLLMIHSEANIGGKSVRRD